MGFSNSSSAIRPIQPQHQVFINFRGAELRKGFLEILVQALKKEQVNVFVDRDELRGKDLKALYDRIQSSKIAVAIFSEKYSESKWCLNELVKIKECVDQGSLHVIPIFFNIKTDDVQNLRGSFGENFRKLRDRYPKTSDLPPKWKEALIFVSEKFGLTSRTRFQKGRYYMFFGNWYLREFAKTITKEVKRVLTEISKREEEEELIKKIRKREELAKAKRNSLSAKTEELIKSVVPRGILVLIAVMLVAPYILCIACLVYFILSRPVTTQN